MGSKPYNEMTLSDGAARAHYQRYSQWLTRQPAERLAQKRAEPDVLFHRVGITFAVDGQEEGAERLIPFVRQGGGSEKMEANVLVAESAQQQ